MNKFIGIGRNTKDGELRITDKNTAIYTNSIAIKNNFKNKEGNYDSEFINYVAYGIIGDYLAKYSKKGTLISIEGRIHSRSYEDKDKIKRYVTEVIVENSNIIQKKKESVEEEAEYVEAPTNIKTDYQDKEIMLEDSDLPF